MQDQTDKEKNDLEPLGEKTVFSFGFLDETIPSDVSDEAVPAERGAYILKNKIGSGGQGEVWEAWQTSLKREIAVKILRHGSKSSFLNEAILTAELDHPNIVPVLDLGSIDAGKTKQDPDALAMAMKRVKGVRWDVLIREDYPKEESDVHDYLQKHLGILRSICHAVAYAHSRKIVHLDLKPSQVIVGAFGEVFLMDWGLAARLEEFQKQAQELSDIRGAFGTPSYMAPEQAIGDYQSIGIATDVYLLGATAFHLSTGKGPHPGDNEEALFFSANMNRVGSFPENIPKSLQRIILKALSTNPKERFDTVEEFRESLEKFLGQASHRKEARELYKQCEDKYSKLAEPEYSDFESLERRLNSAINMSPSTDGVHKLKDDVLVSHAKLAINKDDLELARLITGRINEEENRTVVEREVIEALEDRLRREEQRRKSRQIAMIAMSMLIVVLGTSGYLLYRSFLQTEGERERAELALVQSQQELARSSLQAAVSHIENQRYAEARESLRQTPNDWRGPEWGYLASMALPEMELVRPRSETYQSLALSGDGEWLAGIDESNKYLLIQNMLTKESSKIPGHWSAINGAAANLLLAGDAKGNVLVFSEGEVVHEIRCGDSQITQLSMTDKQIIIASDSENIIWISNIEEDSAKEYFTTNAPITILSTHQQYFAIGTGDGEVWHGDSVDKSPVLTDQLHTCEVRGFSWYPLEEGDYTPAYFFSWAWEDGVQQPLIDDRFYLHQAGKIEAKSIIDATEYAITSVAWTPDGKHVVFGNAAAYLHELDSENWQLVRSIYHTAGIVWELGFIPESEVALSVTYNTMSFRELEWFDVRKSIHADSREIYDLVLSKSDVISCGPDGGISLFSSESQSDALVNRQFPNRTLSMDHAITEKFMVTGQQLGNIRFWDTSSAELNLIQEHWANEQPIKVNTTDDSLKVLAQFKDSLMLYYRENMSSEFRVDVIRLNGLCTTSSIQKEGSKYFAALEDGRIFSGTNSFDIQEHLQVNIPLTSSASHKSMSEFIAGTEDGHVIIFKPDLDEEKHRFKAHTGAIRSLSFDREASLLLTTSDDETAKLWDFETRTLLKTFRGSHSSRVTSGYIIEEEGRVVTACRDSGIRFFDIETELELMRFTKHRYGVLDIAPSPYRYRFYSTGQDMIFRTWLGVPWDKGNDVFINGADEWRL